MHGSHNSVITTGTMNVQTAERGNKEEKKQVASCTAISPASPTAGAAFPGGN